MKSLLNQTKEIINREKKKIKNKANKPEAETNNEYDFKVTTKSNEKINSTVKS